MIDEKELLTLCKSASTAFKIISSPYWTAEIYGFGRYIRKYGYYPSWLPLCISTDHGAGVCYQFSSELESSAPVQLCHSPISVKTWRSMSKKPCFCLYSPFAFYRKENGIERLAEAKGTIAFPAHTSPHLDDTSDIQTYIDQLKKLPVEFQPVDICLHMTDINKGAHKKFIANGFNVYTAGNIYDDNFIERFYSIIKNYKYSTSNYLGSYTYYCVEMGIPFFVYGQGPQYINKDDPTSPIGEFDPYQLYELHRKAHDLFATVKTTITEEQKRFVNRDLGIYDGLSRVQLAIILYYSLFRRIFMWDTIVTVLKRIRKAVSNAKRFFASFLFRRAT